MMDKSLTTLTVTQLNRQVRSWLEQDLGEVNVLGELSNLGKPSSGHLYFTLKDQMAQLRCVFFRNYHNALTHQFTDGQQVIARGKLSLYEARGDYQLIVQELCAAGIGELYQQFERLKLKLEQQGLFAQSRKKSLTRYPLTIGVITSSTSAALRDILSTLARRYPIAKICIYHCEVQGKTAAQQIVNAITQANEDCKADVILLARGGGSIEDLWAFNDEQLALAISKSKVPIISGVGHETDFTIADFVADLRAATPTAAAEAATPDRFELEIVLNTFIKRMHSALSRLLKHYLLILSHQYAKLTSPGQLISNHWQTLDYKERQLTQCLYHNLRYRQHRLQLLLTTLQAKNPRALLALAFNQLQQNEQRLLQLMQSKINHLKQDFANQISTLQAVSPLATLARGYAIVTRKDKVVFSSNEVNRGESIKVQLAQGNLHCNVFNKE